MSQNLSATETRALELLGSGVSQEHTAAALGVDKSRISQLLAREEFAAQVAEARFTLLASHNKRDNKYDELEDQLIEKLESLLPLMLRPMEVLKSIQIINAAKRRGQSAPEHITNQQTVVTINIPTVTVSRFTTNHQNQVISAGHQELLTIQSGSLLKEVKEAENARIKTIAAAAGT